MTLKDVFEEASKIGDFPMVKVETALKHFPSNIGKIVEIRKNGVGVDFGGKWNKWFWLTEGQDKRSHYMSELTFVDKNKRL